MKIEYSKTVKVDELAHLVPTKAGATFSQLWQVFYYTKLFKYIHKKQFGKIKPAYNKICTHKNLQNLCELGYMKNPRPEVYCATNRVLPILNEAGFTTSILPNESTGTGDINELNNTEAFIHLAKGKYFRTLLFPQFNTVIPDALLVEQDMTNSRYKLTFIEIEAEKPKWNQYLDDKRDKYVCLSKSIEVFEYWQKTALLLNLPEPDINTFNFNVAFVCSIKKDYGEDFRFFLSAAEVCAME